ncbi:hypothetical protein VUR80DRAFT_3529 [Thermomyces stellatus]
MQTARGVERPWLLDSGLHRLDATGAPQWKYSAWSGENMAIPVDPSSASCGSLCQEGVRNSTLCRLGPRSRWCVGDRTRRRWIETLLPHDIHNRGADYYYQRSTDSPLGQSLNSVSIGCASSRSLFDFIRHHKLGAGGTSEVRDPSQMTPMASSTWRKLAVRVQGSTPRYVILCKVVHPGITDVSAEASPVRR